MLSRQGKLVESSKAERPCSNLTFSQYKPSKVVHIGHSFGSFTTGGMLAAYGNLSDGAILTGFLINSESSKIKPESFGFEFAQASDPRRFADRPSGYIVQATESNIQQIF